MHGTHRKGRSRHEIYLFIHFPWADASFNRLIHVRARCSLRELELYQCINQVGKRRLRSFLSVWALLNGRELGKASAAGYGTALSPLLRYSCFTFYMFYAVIKSGSVSFILFSTPHWAWVKAFPHCFMLFMFMLFMFMRVTHRVTVLPFYAQPSRRPLYSRGLEINILFLPHALFYRVSSFTPHALFLPHAFNAQAFTAQAFTHRPLPHAFTACSLLPYVLIFTACSHL